MHAKKTEEIVSGSKQRRNFRWCSFDQPDGLVDRGTSLIAHNGQEQPVRLSSRSVNGASRSTGLRLGVEEVIHHWDDDGHALHQRHVSGVGQDGQS